MSAKTIQDRVNSISRLVNDIESAAGSIPNTDKIEVINNCINNIRSNLETIKSTVGTGG